MGLYSSDRPKRYNNYLIISTAAYSEGPMVYNGKSTCIHSSAFVAFNETYWRLYTFLRIAVSLMQYSHTTTDVILCEENNVADFQLIER